MIKRVVENKEVNTVFCDICGKKAVRSYTCHLCKIDLCENCMKVSNPPGSGDAISLCAECKEASKALCHEGDELYSIYFKALQRIIADWVLIGVRVDKERQAKEKGSLTTCPCCPR